MKQCAFYKRARALARNVRREYNRIKSIAIATFKTKYYKRIELKCEYH